MSCCRRPSPEAARNQALEDAMRQDFATKSRDVNVLVLGPEGSGKRTLLKQLRILHHAGFGDAEREQWVEAIHHATAQAMQGVVRAARRLGLEWPHHLQGAVGVVMGLGEGRLAQDEADAIEALWASPTAREAYSRSRRAVGDSASFFFDSLERTGQAGYRPTDEDIVRCSAPAAGVTTLLLQLMRRTINVIDVGGQRNLSRKWLHHFDSVTTIIFVASLSDYDEYADDGRTNRLDECLGLFGAVTNNPLFRRTGMVLLLNKRDLFQEKLASSPLKRHYPDFQEGADFDAAVHFVTAMFLQRAGHSERPVFVHITNNNDTNNVHHVFNACLDVGLPPMPAIGLI